MASLFLALVVFLLGLSFVGAVVYVVMTVRDHMENSPAAAKAIYEHVFLPVFVRVPEPENPAVEPAPDPGIDPDDLAL